MKNDRQPDHPTEKCVGIGGIKKRFRLIIPKAVDVLRWRNMRPFTFSSKFIIMQLFHDLCLFPINRIFSQLNDKLGNKFAFSKYNK